MKNKGDQFRLIEEKHENFIAAVKKRDKVAATKVKMSGSVKQKKKKNVNRNTYNISSIKRVTRTFYIVVVQNNGNERETFCRWSKVKCRESRGKFRRTKKVSCTCKVVFHYFFGLFSLPLPLSIIRFYLLFEKTIDIKESFAFSPKYWE